MIILVSPEQRRIALAALTQHKALAQGAAAVCKRLHVDERPLLAAIGANDYLAAILKDIPSGDNSTREVNVPIAVVEAWRAMLSVWQKDVMRRSDQLSLLEVRPDRSGPERAAGALLAQLNERAELPQLALAALAEADHQKPTKGDVKEVAAAAGLVRTVVPGEAPARPVAATPAAEAKPADGWDEGPPPATARQAARRVAAERTLRSI